MSLRDRALDKAVQRSFKRALPAEKWERAGNQIA